MKVGSAAAVAVAQVLASVAKVAEELLVTTAAVSVAMSMWHYLRMVYVAAELASSAAVLTEQQSTRLRALPQETVLAKTPKMLCGLEMLDWRWLLQETLAAVSLMVQSPVPMTAVMEPMAKRLMSMLLSVVGCSQVAKGL